MSRLHDFVKETTATVGAGTYTLDGASPSFRAFSVASDGETLAYSVQQLTVVGGVITAGEREVGIGTYNAALNQLSRDTILSSTNGGSAVVWGSGTKDIFITTPAALIPLLLTPLVAGDAGKALVVGAGGLGIDLLANVLSLSAALVVGDANKFIKVNGAGTGIVPVAEAPLFSTGDIKLTAKKIADAGWVMMKDRTIGNAASGATERANADTEPLFTVLYDNYDNTQAPVSGGRGASAAADYAANKTLQVLRTVGRGLGIAGAGAGLTTRTAGDIVGAETHPLTGAETGPHTHTARHGGDLGYDSSASGYPRLFNTAGVASTWTTQSGGSGSAHNNMQPTTFLNAMIKL